MRLTTQLLFILAITAISAVAAAQDDRVDELENPRLFTSRLSSDKILQTAWEADQAPVVPPAENSPFVGGAGTDAWAGAAPNAATIGGPESTRGTWWIIAPYAWVPGIHGQITTFGQTRNVSIDTSDVLSSLDDANGALQLHLESGRGPFGLILDTNIIRFTQGATIPAGRVDFDLAQSLIELLGVYRLLELPSELSDQQTYSVDFLGGARYYGFSNGVTVTPFGPPQTAIPLGQNATWVDLVVGARGRAPLVTDLDAFFRCDFGGFGMGTSSTLAWNLIAGLNWQMTEHCSLAAGYRVLDIDASQGSGTARFAFNAKMQGPFLGLVLQY